MTSNEEDKGRGVADAKDKKIEDLEWALAFVLALFGTYAVFNYVTSRVESSLVIFLAIGIAFIFFLTIASALRKYLSILIMGFISLSTIFVIYEALVWFNS